MYKKALNSFFLRVHPDFFHHNREQRVVNENAVAQLNELLNWAREFKGGTLRPPPATTISFTFHQRADEVDREHDTPASDHDHTRSHGLYASSTSSSSSSSFRSSQPPPVLHSTFELPHNFVPSEANRGLVHRAVHTFLRDLLRRAGCMDAVAEATSLAEDEMALRNEAQPMRQRTTPVSPHHRVRRRASPPTGANRDGTGESSSSSGLDAHEGGAPSSLLEAAVEAVSARWSITAAPTLEELIDADLILFAKELSPLQCASALHTLRAHLGEMRYDVWESMPLIVGTEYDVGCSISGSITIPWDFHPAQFCAVLEHNREAVVRCRGEAVGFATQVETAVAELCRALQLDDILISCPHRAALPTLQLLRRHVDELAASGVTALTLEVGEDYATRANGVVVVRAAMSSTAALRAWLRALRPKLPLQKQLYTIAKQMLESTLWHLKEFRATVQPAGVDGFVNNDLTYAQRLEWAKELFRIGPALAQWDWSDCTFLLSSELDLDWSSRQLALPYNFDGDALVRYVEDIQMEAKQKQRTALLQQSAMRHAKEQEEMQQRHARELLLEHDGGAHASAQTRDERAPRRNDASRAAMYRRTHPHLEEYMVSSEDVVDPLTVERPLTHAVTFGSDAEAEDQLKWEGFYQEPVVDQVPTSDLDDKAHAYMLTNRWHREAAAKRLVEELRGTYNKKGRRFDYQKMGDVLEINNARVQPKGFPTLTRGVKSGDV